MAKLCGPAGGHLSDGKEKNVSTTEVAEILNRAQGVLESNVYGVSVENTEGKREWWLSPPTMNLT